MQTPEKQNLTVSLPKDIIRRAKVLAAERDTSISQLVSELIKKMIEDNAAYQQARAGALAYLKKGFHLGAERRWTREELHDRKNLR